ncbi:MAG TPA: hypothetical protein VG675_07640 [Bryobacteraceae bacterium]|nr:hypothetical protein [Bryobacteraceae bacterium]
MLRLPVSAREIEICPRAGWDELLLLEQRDDVEAAIQVVSRLAMDETGRSLDAASLTVTDLEAALLEIRRTVFGDFLRTDVRCPEPGCGAGVSVSFRISQYLTFHPARQPRGVKQAPETGWFRLSDSQALFRLPIAADRRLLRLSDDPAAELARRCVRPEGLRSRELARIERAIATMAPSLSDSVAASCPECGHKIEMYFDVFQFVIAELRSQARFLFADVHTLASQYHWSEAAILDMPSARRVQYAEMIDEARR